MAQQYNAILAEQLVNFRGSSTVSGVSWPLPNFRAITASAYGVRVYNGVSGIFGVHILGRIGGNTATYILAGVTNISAIGNYVLWPVGYSSGGQHSGIPSALQPDAIVRLDQIIAPSHVVFESNGAANSTGISSSIEVSGAFYANR